MSKLFSQLMKIVQETENSIYDAEATGHEEVIEGDVVKTLRAHGYEKLKTLLKRADDRLESQESD